MPGKKYRGDNMSSMARKNRTSSGADGSMGMSKSSNYAGIFKTGGNVRTTTLQKPNGRSHHRKGSRRGNYQAGDTYRP